MPIKSVSMEPGHGFHVLTKPIGPICNLDCKYCFYLEKEKLYPGERKWAMSDDVLEAYILQYIAGQAGPEVYFAWQGGEPTLLGVGFFQRAIELQRKYAGGKHIFNALQTNGTLLDDDWCAFFSEHAFLVGLSIDGPAELHDAYRVDKHGGKTFEAVMRGLGFLQKHGVDFNTLTVVNRVNAEQPLELYRFLKEIGSAYLQFIPLVERVAPAAEMNARGVQLAEPPVAGEKAAEDSAVTDWSVKADQYGRFLCAIFDHWVRHDVGQVFVQLFDVALENWMGLGSSLCVFAETCGAAMAIEHNGDLYSCDHYVYPQYKLGNVMNLSLGEMARSAAQAKFGNDKLNTLPEYCRQCEVRFACNGECPKHRFLRTPDGEEGLNYLCAAYKHFFRHVDPYMRTMGELLRAGNAAAEIMAILRAEEREL
ncbi:MAG TPA: anaerobic sulfatase maturase [Pirellulales bacterium]|nr:anaerobic sulfatase maturase [Pirellulales bacterium]